MNHMQQSAPRAPANGFVHRRADRESGGRMESNKAAHLAEIVSNNFGNAGIPNGSRVSYTSRSRDRLIYVMTYLIGHRVEVHIKNGSIISGIFHSANTEKDFGIVLKMAQLTKDGSVRGQKSTPDIVKRPQTMIIPASELVQVIAKDIALTSEESMNGYAHDKHKDLMIDSIISNSHRIEERELERWTPDEDNQECLELEKLYDRKFNRNWDQFETNETLFGVKTTFNEELYTTKLERGPHMRDLEKQASRIAREIEDEETEDLHLAEERGVCFNEDFYLDEEMKYSAVHRDVDHRRFQGNEKPYVHACNTDSFETSIESLVTGSSDSFSKKVNNDAHESSTCSSVDEEVSSYSLSDRNFFSIDSTDCAVQLTSDCSSKKFLFVDEDSRLDKKQIEERGEEKHVETMHTERTSSEEDKASGAEALKRLPSSCPATDPSHSGQENKRPDSESSDSAVSSKIPTSTEPINPSVRPGSCTSSTSERVGASSGLGGTGLSPSSSMGSLSSERSTLNPNAKEFKLNPNAKSFTPSASLRPQTPVSDGSFYYPGNMLTVPQMPGLPGMGIGASFGGHHQSNVYYPPGPPLQSPPVYIQPNGSVYGQQMIMGQQPVHYVPSYTSEMPYRGRNF